MGFFTCVCIAAGISLFSLLFALVITLTVWAFVDRRLDLGWPSAGISAALLVLATSLVTRSWA